MLYLHSGLCAWPGPQPASGRAGTRTPCVKALSLWDRGQLRHRSPVPRCSPQLDFGKGSSKLRGALLLTACTRHGCILGSGHGNPEDSNSKAGHLSLCLPDRT